MNLDRLRTFRAVAEVLHIRRAAARLHLSQSAVSQQVSALEEELGVMLLERIGRRIYLTAAGQALARESEKVLAAHERLIETVSAEGAGDAGRLRLGTSTTPGVYLVPQALGRLRAALPHVEVTFRIANSGAIARDLVSNDLDLGVIGEEIAQDELFLVHLRDDVIVPVAAPVLLGAASGRRAARQRTMRATDLAAMPLLSREVGSATQRHVDALLERIGVATRPAFWLPSPEAQVRAAAAGLGVAFVSRHAAEADLAAGRLVELRVPRARLVRPIAAAYHRDKRVSPAMRKLIDLLRRPG